MSLDRNDAAKIKMAASLAAKNPLGYLREATRLPLLQQASDRIASLPQLELADVTGAQSDVAVRIAASEHRHAWSLGVAEQLILQILVRTRECKTVFEIGTFNGGTTRLLAETLPEDGRIWTLDLPPQEFDQTQSPKEFSGSQVGQAYKDSPARHKIVQLLEDSQTWDSSPYAESADLVLVDAAHEYENGFADTKTALKLLRPSGIIVWDDFEPYWYGLVNGICDAMTGKRLGKLRGTSFAIYDSASTP